MSNISEGVEVVLEAANPSDLRAVIDLLGGNGLPVADVEHHIDNFVLAKAQDVLVGTTGVEYYGDVALLRSLCVAESYRKTGIGCRLLFAAESIAGTRGVRDLYLLTTGASGYFTRHAYAQVARGKAPVEIQETAEWSSLCPSSAICMRKALGGTACFVPRNLLPMREDIPGTQMWSVRLRNTMLTYYHVAPDVRFETHEHSCEQITTVVEGELLFEIGGAVFRLGPGDVVAVPPGVRHAVFTKASAARAYDSWSTPFP